MAVLYRFANQLATERHSPPVLTLILTLFCLCNEPRPTPTHKDVLRYSLACVSDVPLPDRALCHYASPCPVNMNVHTATSTGTPNG
jgi:hypothetical protein